MNVDDAGKLECLLQRCDAGEDHAWRELGSVRIPGGAPGEHLTLEALERLVAQRRDQPREFELPEHVSACSMCLEAYETMLEAAAAPPPQALVDRGVALFHPRTFAAQTPAADSPGIPVRPAEHRRLTRALAGLPVAAIILLAVGIGWYGLSRPSSAVVTAPGLVFENGQPLAPGVRIPQQARLVARQPLRAAFDDGSALELTQATRFSIDDHRQGTVVNLHEGQVTATVSSQAAGKTFRVSTPLGEVMVIGTRFSVSMSWERVTVFEHALGTDRDEGRPEKVLVVRVRVYEGAVWVRNQHHERVQVEAGRLAILRENQPTIDLLASSEGASPQP